MKSNLISVLSKKGLVLFLIFTLVNTGFSQNDEPDSVKNAIGEEFVIPTSPFPEYFQPLSSEEAQTNYNNINTSGQLFTVSEVPNNRPVNDSRVSDPHRMLTNYAIDTLNKIMKMIEESTGYQMAVVCINSIGDLNPNAFGTELFNFWGIGESGKDNGFLMLVINDIHRVEFINGRGTEVVLTDLKGEDIRQHEMIPHFRNNDYVTGVIRGTQAVGDVFYGLPLDYSYSSDYETTSSYTDNYTEYNEAYRSTWHYRLFGVGAFLGGYILLTAAIILIYLLFLLFAFVTKDYHKRYHRLKAFTLLIFPILFPLPFFPLLFFNKRLMKKWRNTERFSAATGTFMIKLDEKSDDEYLKPGQITEEVINSIDYDVWITEDKSEVLILPYKRWFSKFRKCPSCKHKTYYKEYDRVISPATYSSSGTGEKKYSCKNCRHSKTKRYTIPRKTRSTTSSSGGYSSGSSGGGYSGGSSWGGGSSGGGGGGSSW